MSVKVKLCAWAWMGYMLVIVAVWGRGQELYCIEVYESVSYWDGLEVFVWVGGCVLFTGTLVAG